MKKKDIIEGMIARTDFPNVGIIRHEDTDIKVKGTIEGQQVRVQIQKARKGRYEGRLLEVTTPSLLETEQDVCSHFGACGGCFYSRIPYEKELEIKEGQVRRLLAPVIGESIYDKIFRGIVPSPVKEGYRNKMEFSFGDEYKDGPLSLGMHKKGAFYDIVSVGGCRIADGDFRMLLQATLEFFKNRQIPYFHRITHQGYLRHLLVRKGMFTGQVMADLVTASGMDRATLLEWKDVVCALELEGSLTAVMHTVNDRISDVVEDQGTEVLFGSEFFTEKLLGLEFQVSPFSFFQTNPYGAEELYSIVRDRVEKTSTVYDLYCGTGTIGQIIADKAERVIGVEIVPEAVKAAAENAAVNNIQNIEFICGDVLKVLDEINTPPDFIILDPPREGVHPRALEHILSYGVQGIIYVSCKPTALARDTAVFLEKGYRPEFIQLVDMFPNTANVETVVEFSRK